MSRRLLVILVALAVPSVAHAAPSLRASVAPARIHVGDAFQYTVVARAPKADGGNLRVVADPGAFVQIAAPTVTHTSDHGDAVITVRESLACLDLGCVSGSAARQVSLPAPQLFSGALRTAGPRATVTVVARVPARAVAAARAVYLTDSAPPQLTPRLAIGAAAGAAIALAVLLAVLAIALGRSALRRTAEPAEARARTVPDLALALRLLRDSANRSSPDRRRAADLVARLAEPRVVDEATRVAWAEPAPQASDVELLAEDVERAGGATR